MTKVKTQFGEDYFTQKITEAIASAHFEYLKINPLSRRYTIRQEYNLGFDIAYYVKHGSLRLWRDMLPLEDRFLRRHPKRLPSKVVGNLFIQFKLASLITSAPSDHWHKWNQSHYLADLRRSKSDPYRQQRLLRKLSVNYPTFWAANSVSKSKDLESISGIDGVLKCARFVKIKSNFKDHDQLSFSRSSRVYLHSEPEETESTSELPFFEVGELTNDYFNRDIYGIVLSDWNEKEYPNPERMVDEIYNFFEGFYTRTYVQYEVSIDYLYRIHNTIHVLF